MDIRRGERRKTLLMAASIMTIVASYMMVKAVRDAVFLAKFSLEAKALVSIGLALCAGLGTALLTRLCRGSTRLRVIFVTNVVVALTLIALWMALAAHAPGGTAMLYVWSSFFGLVIIANFWLLANELYDARAAKRLFALLGAGAILGGIVGGVITKALAERIGAINLLPVIGGGLLLSAGLAWGAVGGGGRTRLPSSGEDQERRARFAEGFRLLRDHRYLRLVASLLLLSTLATTLIDYQIQSVVREHFGADRDAMAGFFGQITWLLSTASLLVQLFVTARFIRRFSVTPALFVLPLTIFLGAGAIALHVALVIPALVVATMAKIGDGGVRFSLDKAAMELLYVPVPSDVKGEAKPVIDTFVDRLGTATTGVIWIIVSAASAAAGANPVVVAALVTIGLVAIWGATIVLTHRQHLRVLREAIPVPTSTATTFAAEDQPGLQIAVDHAAPRVRAWAFDVLAAAGDSAFMLKAQRALRDWDPGVRAAARRYLGRAGGDEEIAPSDAGELSRAVDGRAAGVALLATLPGRPPGARTGVLRALWRIHRRAGISFQPATVTASLDQEIDTYRAHARALAALDRGPRRSRPASMRLLLRTLDRALAGDRERLFRLLGLCYPELDVLAAYRGLRDEDPAVRAHALELLDNLLDQPLRRRLIAALEAKRVAAAAYVDDTLRELSSDADPWVGACADHILEEEHDHAHDHREDAAASGHPAAPRPTD